MPGTPVDERGYARPELLADTDWLAQRLGDPSLRIIDTRNAQLYEAGHIPGAVSLAAAGAIPRATDGDMGTPEEFARLAGALGVSSGSAVVVYDAPAAAMGMLAWSFLYYGHENVRVLDGGFAKWSSEGRAVSTAPASPQPVNFAAAPEANLYCSLAEAKAGLGQAASVFWDTRTQAEYDGTVQPGPNTPPRLGHIPGAVHLAWTELLDPESRTLKPAAELRSMLGSRGITPESEINCY